MKLPLAYYGDAILRKKGARIEAITDEIRKLVKDMIETMQAHHGIGLAAPQVHQSLALFITHAPIERPDGTLIHLQEEPIRVFINPKLSLPSDEVWTHSEGCLSIPGISGPVSRPYKITVTYTNLEGETLTEDFSGWPARVIMHENDHINGALYIDRMDPQERKKIAHLLTNLKKKISQKKEREKFDNKVSTDDEVEM